MTANPVSEESASPLAHGEGYLMFVGYLQVVAGVLTVLFSVCAIVVILAADAPSLLNPLEAARSYAAPGSEMLKLLAGYMSFQIVAGWLFGLLMILAGILLFIRRGRTTVAAVAVLNLVNFPHGTTVAIMVLHGLGRPGIAGAFR